MIICDGCKATQDDYFCWILLQDHWTRDKNPHTDSFMQAAKHFCTHACIKKWLESFPEDVLNDTTNKP